MSRASALTSPAAVGSGAASKKKKVAPKGTAANASVSKSSAGSSNRADERRVWPSRPKPASIDLSQCHNESLDLVRLIISLHPHHLVESRHRLNHHAMHSGTDGYDYYDRLASLLWTGRAAAKSLENFQRMNMRLGQVFTNHFPGVDDMCAKNYLAKKLKLMERIYPGQYDFVPRTWILPQEWETFRADAMAATTATAAAAAASAATAGASTSATPATAAATGAASSPTYIFKPSNGSQGTGIMLAQSMRDIERIYRLTCLEEGVSLTVQEYISKPLLLGGLKFDFRIYVILESLQPLRMHLYEDGLARFCTEVYQEPTNKNLKMNYMHLTNSSLNKGNEEKFKIQSTADLTDAERMALNRELVAQSNLNVNLSSSSFDQKENPSPSPSSSPRSSTRGSVIPKLNSRSNTPPVNATTTSNQPPPSSSSTAPSSSPPLPAPLPSGPSVPAGIFPPDFNLTNLGFDLREEEQSKRSIRTVLQQLRTQQEKDGDKRPPLRDKEFWQSIANIVSKTIISLWPPLMANYKVAFPVHRPSLELPSTCFHLLGFDVLMDSDFKPWLLELNCSPSLNIESTLDLVLKKGMLEKGLSLLGYLGEEKRPLRKRRTMGTITSTSTTTTTTPPQVAPIMITPADEHTRRTSPSPSSSPVSTPNPSLVPPSLTPSGLPRHPTIGIATTSRSLPTSGATTPQTPTIHETSGGSNSTSARASPITLHGASGTNGLAPPPVSPLVPLIPFSHRRTASVSVPTTGVKYVVLPSGTIQVQELKPPTTPTTSTSVTTPTATTPSSASPTTTPNPATPTDESKQSSTNLANVSKSPPAGTLTMQDQDAVEYLEICPEEEWSAGLNGSNGSTHPLLLFQHPKLLSIFDKYTLGSTIKKLSSSKFMQACVACKIVVSGKPPPIGVNTSQRPISHWPTRPDIDLLFMQHTKLLDTGSGSASIGSVGTGKMLDFAGFCDAIVQIVEIKYKHLIQPPINIITTTTTMTPATPTNATAPAAPVCALGNTPPAPPQSPAPMSLLDAIRHFIDSIVLPEEKSAVTPGGVASGTGGKESPIGILTEREQAAKVASAQLSASVTLPPVSAFSSNASLTKKTPVSSPNPLTRSLAVGAASTTMAAPPVDRLRSTLTGDGKDVKSASPSAFISPAQLSATISSLLAPKDPAASVFNRLTGAAQSATVKKRVRPKPELQPGTYEAFMAAYQQRKAKTNKK